MGESRYVYIVETHMTDESGSIDGVYDTAEAALASFAGKKWKQVGEHAWERVYHRHHSESITRHRVESQPHTTDTPPPAQD